MDAKEFCQGYRAPKAVDVPDIEPLDLESLPDYSFAELYKSSDQWSDIFGGLLFERLSIGTTYDTREIEALLIAYNEWHRKTYRAILDTSRTWYSRLRDSGADEETLGSIMKRRNHATFHDLNLMHLHQWKSLLAPSDDDSFADTSRETKFHLAWMGSSFTRTKMEFIKERGEASYFDHENALDKASLEGFLHEVDAGIVLHEIASAKERRWIVLPAPANFEYRAAGRNGAKNANTNFLVIDPQDAKAIGIQVKSTVSDQAREEYDPERIVLLDAFIDLNSQSARQTERKSSNKRIVHWGGLIAIEHLASIKRNSRQGRVLKDHGGLGIHLFACREARTASPQMRDSAHRVTPRIVGAL